MNMKECGNGQPGMSGYQDRWQYTDRANYYVPPIDQPPYQYHVGAVPHASLMSSSRPIITSPAPFVPYATPWTTRSAVARPLEATTSPRPAPKRHSLSQDPFTSPNLDSLPSYDEEDIYHYTKKSRSDMDNYWPPLQHPFDGIADGGPPIDSSFHTPNHEESDTSHDESSEYEESPPPPPSRKKATPVLGEVLPKSTLYKPSAEEMEAASTSRAQQALLTWYDRMNDLCDYKNRYGDTNVPQKYSKNPALGIWVNKQRMEKKLYDEGRKSSMTPSKLKVLEHLGFDWGKRKGQHSWNTKYKELCEYKEAYGEDPPTKLMSNPALGRWVSTQRAQYKQYMAGEKTHMTNKRKDLLEKVGFCWAKIEEHEPVEPVRRSRRRLDS